MQTHLSMALLPLLAVVVRPALSSPFILASGKQTVKLSQTLRPGVSAPDPRKTVMEFDIKHCLNPQLTHTHTHPCITDSTLSITLRGITLTYFPRDSLLALALAQVYKQTLTKAIIHTQLSHSTCTTHKSKLIKKKSTTNKMHSYTPSMYTNTHTHTQPQRAQPATLTSGQRV